MHDISAGISATIDISVHLVAGQHCAPDGLCLAARAGLSQDPTTFLP